MTTLIPHWIRGAEASGTSGRTAPVHNPATGEQTAEVALASTDDVATAVASAKEAAIAWRESSLSRRSAVLFAFRQLLHERTDELAAIIEREMGKPAKVDAHTLFAIASNTKNVTAAALLYTFREGDSNMRGVWICSRNDAIGNVAVVIAAVLVWWLGTPWPDLIVAFAVAGLFLQSAWSIIRDARSDLTQAARS